MGSGNWGGEQAGTMESRPMWYQLGPPIRRQSPVRALCSVILGFTFLAATLALVLSWLLATGILDPGAPARAQAARKLDISRLPTPTTRLPRPTTKLPSTTTAPTPSQPATTASEVSLSCEAPSFLCKDGVTCLGASQICDGVMDCPRHELGEGGDDEDNCAAGSGEGELNISPILVALTSRPEVTVTTERFVAEEGVAILEEETQNVLSEVLRVVGETRRRLEETKDSTAASVEEVTTVDPSRVTKEVDNAVASTTLEVVLEEGGEEDIALVTEESSSAVEVETTKPIEVWTLRPNWSTGGSTLQNEETTNAVSLADDATVNEVTTTEKMSTIGDVVTTEAAKTAQDTTPAFTISASTSEEATEPSIVTAEESITESERKEIITTTVLPLAEDSSVATDVTEAISVTTDSDVTIDSDVTTESSDEKELPEVNLERDENEVEIDAESETEKNESSAEEEFAVERPRSLS